MSTGIPAPAPTAAPGTERPRRYRPKLRYELIGCGLHGHELLGTDAAELRPGDQLFARETGGLRWYRCLRCDSWVVLTPPAQAARRYPPSREEITLPLRGRPLRDRYVLRLIAVERVLHFLVLSALAAAVLLFASNKAALNADFTRILRDLQGGFGGPLVTSRQGVVHDLDRLFAKVRSGHGCVDVLMANAGLGALEPLGKITEAAFDLIFDVNVKGTVFTAQKGLPLMQDGGSIIVTGSTTASMGTPALASTAQARRRSAISPALGRWT